jgi:hypothetical protein
MQDLDLQCLIDRAAISDVVHAYATGLDRRDWALFRSIFSDSIEMDFESVGLRPAVYDAGEWVRDAARLFAGFEATQHTSSNHVHTVTGDHATCVSNMQATHFIAPEPGDDFDEAKHRWTIGGYYDNSLVRTVDGWRLAKVRLNVTWQTGNQGLSRVALRRGRALEAAST